MPFIHNKFTSRIFDFVTNGQGNAVINAVAGSGKTTTIVELLKILPQNIDIYFLAFNNAIVEELEKRTPDYVNVKTLHSLGSGAIKEARRSQLNKMKSSAHIDKFKRIWAEQDQVKFMDYDYLTTVRKLIDLYRVNLCKNIDELDEQAEKHGLEITNGECERAMEVLVSMNNDQREHDFVDMLYLPATDPIVKSKLPKTDWLFLDECQDTNKAQQEIVRQVINKPGARFIAVGDPGQAIYGFAGSDAESFTSLKSFPNTIELPLSVNYRCGKKIIELAKKIVPYIECHENAIDGEYKPEASENEIKDGDMVLCRNVAPLVSLCLKNIRQGKKAYVKGGEMGKTLANLIKRSRATTIDQLDIYFDKQLFLIEKRILKKHPYLTVDECREDSAYVMMNDKIKVIEAVIDVENIQQPAQLIKWIEDLFADTKAGICFSSIHKSKGLENERVFIIERNLMPSKYAKKDWQKVQETNLEYVAYTRAKSFLGIVTDWEYKSRKKKKSNF